MSDYERMLWVLAEEFESSISSCFRKAGKSYEWVDSNDEAESLMRRMRGTFIASLVGEIEERINRSFSSTFDQLPDTPTQKRSRFWFEHMPINSTVRGRAKVMWAIRIAYTHGNGHISQVNDPSVAASLEPSFASNHFRGVTLQNNFVRLSDNVTHPAIKTVLEIDSRFG